MIAMCQVSKIGVNILVLPKRRADDMRKIRGLEALLPHGCLLSNSTNRQSFCKKCYLQDLGRPSTTFLAHLFGKIDSFLLFCSLRSPRKRGSSKTARKNQFCQTNVREKLLKN